MTFTVGEILFLMAAVVVIVFLAKGMTIIEALTRFNEKVGKKWKEQQEKNRRSDKEKHDKRSRWRSWWSERRYI